MASLEEFESILNAVGRGDRRAFHQLFDLTAARLFGLCKAILDDDDWADEVLENAYIEIWQNAISWRDSGLTPITWVLSMAREYAIAARRDASDETPDPRPRRTFHQRATAKPPCCAKHWDGCQKTGRKHCCSAIFPESGIPSLLRNFASPTPLSEIGSNDLCRAFTAT